MQRNAFSRTPAPDNAISSPRKQRVLDSRQDDPSFRPMDGIVEQVKSRSARGQLSPEQMSLITPRQINCTQPHRMRSTIFRALSASPCFAGSAGASEPPVVGPQKPRPAAGRGGASEARRKLRDALYVVGRVAWGKHMRACDQDRCAPAPAREHARTHATGPTATSLPSKTLRLTIPAPPCPCACSCF